MKFKIIFLILFLQLTCHQIMVGQNTSFSKNSIYYEFYGTAWGPISINYDRIIKISDNVLIAPGLGVSLTKCLQTGGTLNMGEYQIYFPAKIDLLFGKTPHKIEIGFGMPLAIDTNDEEELLVGSIYVLRLGYRYQPHQDGLVFRVSLNPAIIAIMPTITGGLSIGYTF